MPNFNTEYFFFVEGLTLPSGDPFYGRWLDAVYADPGTNYVNMYVTLYGALLTIKLILIWRIEMFFDVFNRERNLKYMLIY